MFYVRSVVSAIPRDVMRILTLQRKQQKIREKEMEALKYLVSLVNDVLDMNKLQSGDLKDQQLLFDLTMVLRELN